MPDLSDLIARVEAADIWRLVPGWPYEASGDGRIRNAGTKKVLRPTLSRSGYERVTFHVDCVRKDVRVHRAVFAAWNGPIPDGLVINHIDGVKTNNAPHNLEAVSCLENVRHASRMGLMPKAERNGAYTKPESRRIGSKNGSSKLTEMDVLEIRRARQNGNSLLQLAKRYHVDKSLIGKISRGEIWRHVA